MRCLICNKTFSEFFLYNIHKKKHAFKCELCDQEFQKEIILKQHIYDHVQFIRYCDTCDSVILNKEYYKFHMEMHVKCKTTNSQKHVCVKCSRSFAYYKCYVTHRLECDAESELSCDLSFAKTFKHKRDLLQHVRRHTSEFPFNCNLCLKGFTRRNCMLVHLRRHHGISVEGNSFKCKECGKDFSIKNNLKRHLRNVHDKLQDLPKNIQEEEYLKSN